MKIVIVGAGVAGLSSYLQFRKLLPSLDSRNIVIYECHRPHSTFSVPDNLDSALVPRQDALTDTAAVVGNNIGLPPQTVRLLKYIHPKLYELFRARGYANKTYMYRTARGHTLALFPTADQGDPPEYTVTCPRQTLWRCLLDVVGEDKITYRRVTDVDLHSEKPVVKFADGGEEEADLVIGADGARSVVKAAMFGKDGGGPEHALEYEGLCGVGGFVETELPETMTRRQSMTFTLGLTGSFGYCAIAPTPQKTLGWWFNWQTPHLPEKNIVDAEEIRKHLQDHVGAWKDPVIHDIIEKMSTDRVYPIWTTPELPHWSASGAVLLGDSAHTVQATSGLGASLSLESSVVFSLLLAHYLNKPDQSLSANEAVQLAAKGLYEIQNLKAIKIRAQARRRLMTKTQIRAVWFEYLFYLWVYLWTNFALFSSMVLGSVESRAPGEVLEEEVRKYIQAHDP